MITKENETKVFGFNQGKPKSSQPFSSLHDFKVSNKAVSVYCQQIFGILLAQLLKILEVRKFSSKNGLVRKFESCG